MALVTIPEIQALDPYFGNVVLLLSGNGANGSTAFSDNSVSKRTVTPVGNAQISTAQSKFGGASGRFDGAGDYLSIPASGNFAFGSGDFTMETWAFLLTAAATYAPFFTTRTFGNAEIPSAVWFGVNPSGGLHVHLGNTLYDPTDYSLPLNQWVHYAWSREAGTNRIFAGGSLIKTFVDACKCTSTNCFIGGITEYWLNAYCDDLRITAGVARYTSNFTPPAAEFPWPDASLLGARAFNTNVARRICAPARALAPGGPVTAAMNANLYRRNIYQGGLGQITGTVKEKSLPANVPLHRRVCLLEEKTRLLVAETWSDATTGNYVFERIDPTRTYTVMAYDHTGLYRAVIADRLVPEMLP